jgi:hypothetical protein
MTPSEHPLLFISGYVPADQVGIQGCRFNPATGALTPLGGLSGKRADREADLMSSRPRSSLTRGRSKAEMEGARRKKPASNRA